MFDIIPRSPYFFANIAARTLASVRQTQPPKKTSQDQSHHAQMRRPDKK